MSSANQTAINLKWYQKLLLSIASFQKKHWIVSIGVVRLSAVWFSLILAYGGEIFHLIEVENGNKKLTWLGLGMTILITVVILLFELAKHVESHITQEPFEIGGFFFLNSLRKGINKICDSKLKTLVTQIDNVKKNKCDPPLIVSNPPKQLQGIADQVMDCLSHLLEEKGENRVTGKDVFTTIAYQFPQESVEWYWATEERGLSLDVLVPKTPNNAIGKSTFRELLESGKNYIFFNRKQEALQTGKYICDEFDEKDDDGQLTGSIACYKFDIKKNDTVYVRAVLSITTYQQPFSLDNTKEMVKNVRENMYDFVIADFAKRIEIELCLQYLSFLRGSN